MVYRIVSRIDGEPIQEFDLSNGTQRNLEFDSMGDAEDEMRRMNKPDLHFRTRKPIKGSRGYNVKVLAVE